jgi:hypothetical protein
MNPRKMAVPAALVALAMTAPSALAQLPPTNGPPPTPSTPVPSTTEAPAPNAVIEWNRKLLTIVRTKTPQPLQPATVMPRAPLRSPPRHLDAVVAVDGGKPYYPSTSSQARLRRPRPTRP